MIRPETPVPADPNGAAIDQVSERIKHLIETLGKSHTKVIIPAPVLSEALILETPQNSQAIIERIQKSSAFQISPFDTPAALELAAMSRNAVRKGNKKENPDATWAKLKFDRQIVAIAKVCGATAIYSDDGDIRTISKSNSRIPVISLSELPLPASSAQQSFPFRAGISARRSLDLGGGNSGEQKAPLGLKTETDD